MTARTYRSRPTAVTALQWRGDNEAEIAAFTGGLFNALDADDRANCDDPEATAQLFDGRNSTWKLVYVGDWVVRLTGVGFVKMSDSAFREQFEVDGTGAGP